MLLGGFVQFILSQYYQKFATDALLLDSAVVGAIFFVSRLTDAVLDPICGYMSDRLRARRIFILAGLLAMTTGMLVAFFPAVSPALAGHWVNSSDNAIAYLCTSVGIFTVYLGVTLVYIPHYAWLAELARANAKVPFFASRAVTENLGTILGGLTLALIIPFQKTGGYSLYLIIAAALAAFFFLGSIPLAMYRSDGTGQPSSSFVDAIRILGRNKRFSLIAAMSFCNQFAATTLLAVSLYYTDYQLGNKELGATVAVVFLLSATAAIPLWTYLARRANYLKLWRNALIIIVLSFPLLFLKDLLLVSALFIGAAAGAVILFVPQEVSRLARENEGVYFAAFTFINKSAMAAAPLIIGLVLGLAGYKPDLRTDSISTAINMLFIATPLAAFVISLWLLTRYAKYESIDRG